MKLINKYQLLLAWIVSVFATLGSLYFSEIKLFIPCEWCWYQRILMYPLSLILGIAYFKKEFSIKIYIFPFLIIGIILSTLHYIIQKVDSLSTMCNSFIPCNIQYINWFGFITIPFLSLTAFLLIAMFLSIKK